MGWKDYREESKSVWGRKTEYPLEITLEEVKTGCFLRIADSLEKMERPYVELLETIEKYKELEIENKSLRREISGLKGVITKLKNSPNK